MDGAKEAKAIQLGEFCQRLRVGDREVRYILERGHVPRGTAKSPSTGNHRQFDAEQAFWLALVVKLGAFGLKVTLAAEIADAALLCLRGVTQNLGWERSFLPQLGHFHTDRQYLFEVADRKYMRLVTDACPSQQDLHYFDWVTLRGRATDRALKTVVVLRIDLAEIARILGGSEWVSSK
jgi:hypothetical protein